MRFNTDVNGRWNTKISFGNDGGKIPATVAQEQLWFFDQLLPGSPAYNMPFPLRCIGPFNNIAALDQSSAEIVRRHESLRTRFEPADDRPIQIVQPLAPRRLNLVDLTGLRHDDRDRTTHRLATEEALRSFELANGPLIRNTILILTSDEKALLRTMHHTVCDGWSVGILNRELTQLAVAFGTGLPSAMSELALQLGEFAVSERKQLQSPALKRQFDYWMQKLNNIATLDLPCDRLRPPVQEFEGARCPVELSAELSARLRDLSRSERTTIFILLMAVFKVLLAQYAGQEDVVVGTPIAGRSRQEYQDLIGPLFNMLVMRTSLSGDPSFQELLGRVRETAMHAYAHADVPFQKLVEALQWQRDMSRSPLFQVTFGFQNMSRQGDGPVTEPLDFTLQTARYDLELHLWERSDGIKGYFVYKTGLFDASTIERMVRHFERLAEQIATNPNKLLSTISMLTDAERFELLESWNNTHRDRLSKQPVHELIESHASEYPDSIAIAFDGRFISYRQFNRKANRLASHLKSRGVRPEDLAGVFMERSPELLVALLAVLKTGAAYLPLDPNYPQQRISYMLSDSRASVLLTQRRLVPRLPEEKIDIIAVDEDWLKIATHPSTPPTSSLSLENLAYVIYTSGSTGNPKAVQVSHRALLNLIDWHLDAFHVTSYDRATQVSGPAFDAAGWELWPYFAARANVTLISEDTRTSPEQLRDSMVNGGITITFLPTPLAETVLSLDWPREAALRYMLTGGDTLHSYPSVTFGFSLVNNYGPTENAVVATSGLVRDKDRKLGPPSIGRPISNSQVYLLDQHKRQVPVNVPGELCIGGDSLARGYLNDPALTAAKFIPSPFAHEPGARIYRTGDLARYRADGDIDFLGRTDHQVKVRGFRIELGEIEAALAQHPEVREAVVMSKGQVGDSRHLAAYFTPSRRGAVNTSQLRIFLKSKLPDYMVPVSYAMVEQFPLTSNGKVDRKALAGLNQDRAVRREAPVPPGTQMELNIISIFEEVLGTENIGIHDNFFDAGANSILIIRVVSKLREALDIKLSIIELFTYPTVSLLVNHLGRQQADQNKPFLNSILDRAALRRKALGW